MVIAIGLIAGNFVYQAFMSDPNWGVAFERSFFQLIAIGCYAFFNR
jgi:hypothetical protein